MDLSAGLIERGCAVDIAYSSARADERFLWRLDSSYSNTDSTFR
jgi:hypothetical protein